MQRSALMRDQYRTPLETAVYWTEYVLRHRGTLLSPASKDLFWFQYYLLDVLAVVLGTMAVAMSAVTMVIIALYKGLKSTLRVKVKLM